MTWSYLGAVAAASSLAPLDISFAQAGSLDPVHRDPFDPLLVAEAVVEGLAHNPFFARHPVAVLPG